MLVTLHKGDSAHGEEKEGIAHKKAPITEPNTAQHWLLNRPRKEAVIGGDASGSIRVGDASACLTLNDRRNPVSRREDEAISHPSWQCRGQFELNRIGKVA
jgi:hypothetical protein